MTETGELIFWVFQSYDSFITVLILIAGFIATVWTIKSNTAERKTSLAHDMAKEERRLQMELTKIALEITNSTNNQNTLEKLRDTLIEQHLNFFEHLAILVNGKKLDGKITKKYFNSLLKQAVENYKERILPDYNNLYDLYKKWKD